MLISRLAAAMIQGHEVMYIDMPERTECWTCRESGMPDALILSCSPEDKSKMIQFVNELKTELKAKLITGTDSCQIP